MQRGPVKTALLCDYALTSEDGRLSVVGIFSNLNFPALPNAYPRFFVVIILSLEAGTHDVSLGIVDPIGQQVLPEQPNVEVDVELSNADTNLMIDFNNMVFNRPGIYQVQLFVEGLLVHSLPLSVQAVSAEDFAPVRAN